MENLLLNLSEEKIEKVESTCLRLADIQDSHYESEIEPAIIERRNKYDSTEEYYKKKFPFLTQITPFTSTDVIDTVEWAMPSVMRVYFGGESIFNLVGVTEEDEASAAVMQDLIDYQIQRKEKGFLEMHDWFKTCFIENFAVMKCYWEREETVIEEQEVYISPANWQAFQETITNPKKLRVIDSAPVDADIIYVKYQIYSYKKNQPRFETIPISEFRFTPDAKDIDECRMVSHRVRVLGDHLRRQERSGVYVNVDEAMESYGDKGAEYTQYDLLSNPAAEYYDEEDVDEDKAGKKFIIRENYIRIDINDDGLLEDCIVTMCGQKAIRIIENPMDRHPFFVISAIRDPKRIFAKKGLADLIGPLQDLKTALLCQIIYNVAVSNDKQAFVNIDSVIDVDEFTEGKKAVRVMGNPREAVFWSPIEPLPPQVFSFIEYIETMKENRTGITRYNQGLDANSLNKTATGVTQIMQAANQRIELICRMIAEGGVVPFVRHLIKLNQMYVDNDIVIRVTNKPKVVKPDDLNGEIDIIVNAGVGTANKQQNMANLQQLLGIYPLLLQMGIATPYNVAFVVGKMVEEMGWKNIQDFITHPAQIKQRMEEAAQQPPQPEEPEQRPVTTRIDYEDLTPEGRVQLAAKAGIKLDPNEVMNQYAMEALRALRGGSSDR